MPNYAQNNQRGVYANPPDPARPTVTLFPAVTPSGDIKLSVILPTRNERDSVLRCVQRLEACLTDFDSEVIFVDDSDDGTDALVRECESALTVRLIHRGPGEREGGLSTAVLQGMHLAQGQYFCVLDADLQHPPEAIASLLLAADAGADIVVASRYVAGGSPAGLGSVTRLAASDMGRRAARALFSSRLRHVKDPLSGFFIVRRDVIAETDLRPVGFKILLEILVRGRWSNVVEVPYAFETRTRGSSKATAMQGWLYLQHLARLRSDGLVGRMRRYQLTAIPFRRDRVPPGPRLP